MNRIDHVIVRPLATEKTARLEAQSNQYAFEVALGSTKIEVKEAIQTLFGVKVADVTTSVVRGKVKRFGRYHGQRSNWKKAVVRLAEGESLNVYSAG